MYFYNFNILVEILFHFLKKYFQKFFLVLKLNYIPITK